MVGNRREFDRQLDAIDVKVIELFAIVGEDLPEVTQALLTGSTDGAGQLAEREQAIDSLYREIELLASREILLQAPVASDLRFLLTVLRVAPELERSHDLECQIASRAGPSLAAELSPRCRGLIEQMSELASSMWRRAADCWYQRDGSAAPALARDNDQMDELHASLQTELASGRMPSPVMMEVTLVARFYQRLADHAVNIARRASYLAGSPTEPATGTEHASQAWRVYGAPPSGSLTWGLCISALYPAADPLLCRLRERRLTSLGACLGEVTGMPDVYAIIAEVDPATVEQVAVGPSRRVRWSACMLPRPPERLIPAFMFTAT